jgi:hypothetical protein
MENKKLNEMKMDQSGGMENKEDTGMKEKKESSGEGCSCPTGSKEHEGHMEGPGLKDSSESGNKSQDEGKTYNL